MVDLFGDAELSGPVAEMVRRVAVAGFHALWADERVTLAELVGGDGPGLAEAAGHLVARGRIELGPDGCLVAVHGLARRATRHRVDHAGGSVHTWCAFDAIGIPAALAIDALAVTSCPACGQELAVAVTGGEPEARPGAVLWFPEGDSRHLVEDFCSGANLFCSSHHLGRWRSARPGAGRPLSVAEAAELGRGSWADVADGP